MTRALVTLDGRALRWKAVSISRSLDAFVGAASVTVPLTAEKVVPGPRLQVTLPGQGTAPPENLLVGFVDAVSGSGDVNGGEVRLEARDRTADLVDGRPVDAIRAWYDATLLGVARDILRPYGLRLVDRVDAASVRLPFLVADPGETDHELLERACRTAAVLLSTTPAGHVVLGRPDRAAAGAELRTGPGGRILSYTWSVDHSQRFRRLKMVGQGSIARLGPGAQARPVGLVEDLAVRPQREAVRLAPNGTTTEELEVLAAYTVQLARARSSSLTVTVPGWRVTPGGAVWRPGLVVPVTIREAGIEGELLVAAVDLEDGDQGEIARLGLVAPDAYEIDPTEAARLRRGGVEALPQ